MRSYISELRRISSGHQLLEGPVYDPRNGLLVADADVGGVLAIKEGHSAEIVVPHRRGIGGMALHEKGGIVVSGRNVAYKALRPDVTETTAVLADRDPTNGIVGYNDLTVDPKGRIYVGSLTFVAMSEDAEEHKAGFLHMIDLDGSVRRVGGDILLTNGLGFSPNGKILYHADSARRVVRKYDVADDGTLGAPEIFVSADNGQPDGLAVAADGSVWVALAFANAVAIFAPDGRELERISIAEPMVTSLCFGGEDLRDVYIVTGSKGASSAGACVYLARSNVPGQPGSMARVQLG